MARVCQVTGKSPMVGNNVSRQQQKRSAASCPTCNTAVSGLKVKTASSACAFPTPACASSTRTASTPSWPICEPVAKSD